MAVTLKAGRYRLEFWINAAGEVEDEAFAYPVLTRPADGTLPAQEKVVSVQFTPSTGLKATLKVEQKNKVDGAVAGI